MAFESTSDQHQIRISGCLPVAAMASRSKTPSSGARAAGQTTIASMFSASTIDFSKEVGKTVEVKGDWWVGGSAAERRAWHLVKIIEYAPVHQFEVTRKGHPTTQRSGKALKIRVVDKGEEDGWTSLMLACQEGHEPCARVLVEAGASIDSEAVGGVTAIQLARKLLDDLGVELPRVLGRVARLVRGVGRGLGDVAQVGFRGHGSG